MTFPWPHDINNETFIVDCYEESLKNFLLEVTRLPTSPSGIQESDHSKQTFKVFSYAELNENPQYHREVEKIEEKYSITDEHALYVAKEKEGLTHQSNNISKVSVDVTDQVTHGTKNRYSEEDAQQRTNIKKLSSGVSAEPPTSATKEISGMIEEPLTKSTKESFGSGHSTKDSSKVIAELTHCTKEVSGKIAALLTGVTKEISGGTETPLTHGTKEGTGVIAEPSILGTTERTELIAELLTGGTTEVSGVIAGQPNHGTKEGTGVFEEPLSQAIKEGTGVIAKPLAQGIKEGSPYTQQLSDQCISTDLLGARMENAGEIDSLIPSTDVSQSSEPLGTEIANKGKGRKKKKGGSSVAKDSTGSYSSIISGRIAQYDESFYTHLKGVSVILDFDPKKWSQDSVKLWKTICSEKFDEIRQPGQKGRGNKLLCSRFVHNILCITEENQHVQAGIKRGHFLAKACLKTGKPYHFHGEISEEKKLKLRQLLFMGGKDLQETHISTRSFMRDNKKEGYIVEEKRKEVWSCTVLFTSTAERNTAYDCWREHNTQYSIIITKLDQKEPAMELLGFPDLNDTLEAVSDFEVDIEDSWIKNNNFRWSLEVTFPTFEARNLALEKWKNMSQKRCYVEEPLTKKDEEIKKVGRHLCNEDKISNIRIESCTVVFDQKNNTKVAYSIDDFNDGKNGKRTSFILPPIVPDNTTVRSVQRLKDYVEEALQKQLVIFGLEDMSEMQDSLPSFIKDETVRDHICQKRDVWTLKYWFTSAEERDAAYSYWLRYSGKSPIFAITCDIGIAPALVLLGTANWEETMKYISDWMKNNNVYGLGKKTKRCFLIATFVDQSAQQKAYSEWKENRSSYPFYIAEATHWYNVDHALKNGTWRYLLSVASQNK